MGYSIEMSLVVALIMICLFTNIGTRI